MSADEYREAAEFYDHFTLYATRTDVKFFVDEALAAKGPVLELGCGTGRVLLPTALAGVPIEGLDVSPSMLEECRRKLAEAPPDVRRRVRLHQGNMRDFDLGRTFALVTIPFRPFQHLLTVDDQLSCLRSIRRHLAPGGRLVFDLFNPSLELLANRPVNVVQAEGEPFTMPDGRQVQRSFRIVAQDRFAQVNDVDLIFDVTTAGRTERHVQSVRMRYLFRFEAEHLLARAGFAVEHLYAGYDRAPYGSAYPGELIFVARPA